MLAGYEPVVAVTGTDAITELRRADHPPVAILDCDIPGMLATEICERMRDAGKDVYLILIREKPTSHEIVSGLESGADLYLSHSIPPEELIAHVKVGVRIISRQRVRSEKLQKADGEWLTAEN
jgi:DNA-binding response OmpR family regulator